MSSDSDSEPNDAETNVLEDPDSSDQEKIDAMNRIIEDADYLINERNKEQCKIIFKKLAEDDISTNGRIGILSIDNTSAPSEMLDILTDIVNNEYSRTQLLKLLTEHTSRVHSNKGGKRKSRKNKKRKTRKSKKSRKSRKTRK